MADQQRTVESEQLVLSHFSLARDHPLDDRIRAAGAASIDAIGLFAGQFMQLLEQDWSVGRLRDELAASDVSLRQVEALSGWGAAEPDDRYVGFERFVWQMVDDFSASYVQAIGPVEGEAAAVAERFGALCDRAAEHGATVGLEFLPFTNIVDANDALEIVERAARPNGGVCFDIWHHVRGANDLELLRRVPSELIVGVQMSDGPAQPVLDDYRDDCLRYRVPPGEGEFSVDDFVALIIDHAPKLPWDLEVCNENVWGAPAADHVSASATAMRAVLAQHLPSQPAVE